MAVLDQAGVSEDVRRRLGAVPLARLKAWVPRVSRYSFAYHPGRDVPAR